MMHDKQVQANELIARIDRLAEEKILPRIDLERLCGELPEEVFQHLKNKAAATRNRIYGNRVFVRGLIELTNYCQKDCDYCGIRRSNTNAARYRMTPDMVIAACEEGYRLGFRTFVMQGGEDPWFTDARLVPILETISQRWPDAAITLSIGERSEASYKALFAAGADRFLLRHETACEKLYQSIHPDSNFHERRECLRILKAAGYQTGAGFMVGIPGQTAADFVEDLYFLKDLNPHMVGIGPFIPHKDTPLGKHPAGNVRTVLQMLGLVRLMLPEVLLPATTALGTIDPLGREKGFDMGANVIMPNLTPPEQKSKYNLYEGKAFTDDAPARILAALQKRVEDAGYMLDMARGDHVCWEHH